MLESKIYYIYIDTRIRGAIDQLIGYFQTNVFNSNDCINVLCKYYKDISSYIERGFSKNNIPFRFIKTNQDMQLVDNKVVFYLFNAQSNCRLVANRELTHIFVTHGESHKSASVKPILRIYDFVITSGQIGVDRLLKASIFSIDDVVNGQKILTLGDTFIGKNQFVYESNSEGLLYAPTWEGGVPSENYSSLAFDPSQRIIKIANEKKVSKIFIQSHPNIGHRDPKYFVLLKQLVKKLKVVGFKVIVIKHSVSFLDYFDFSKVEKIDINGKSVEICFAITDISAMEMQFFHENIPTCVFVNQDQISGLIIPRKVQHLYDHELSLDAREQFVKLNRDYFFGYVNSTLLKMSYKNRLIWLCNYARSLKDQKQDSALNQF